MNFIMSMNIRGLVIDLKFLALKDIFHLAQPKSILIQETMHSSRVYISYFRKMFPSWYMVASEARGLSGRLTILWDPESIKAKAYKCFSSILISAVIKGQRIQINILNTYAPYKNRIPFWEKLFASEIFDIESLMIVGDLNVTLNSDEFWRNCRKRSTLR